MSSSVRCSITTDSSPVGFSRGYPLHPYTRFSPVPAFDRVYANAQFLPDDDPPHVLPNIRLPVKEEDLEPRIPAFIDAEAVEADVEEEETIMAGEDGDGDDPTDSDTESVDTVESCCPCYNCERRRLLIKLLSECGCLYTRFYNSAV